MPIRPAPKATPSRAAPPAGALPGLAVRILVAGVHKDDRGAVEAAVRQGLGSRASSGAWSVSVVQLAGRWSVTLDGGGLRSASVVTERGALADAVRSLVGGSPSAKATTPPVVEPAPPTVPGTPGVARDRHDCEQCGRGMVVVYESQPDEPRELAPVACPHCWAIGHVEVGAWAAAGRDYRAEQA